MTDRPTATGLPGSPPAELHAELDAAAAALAALADRGATLALGVDARGLAITLADADGTRRLTPSQLFDVLA